LPASERAGIHPVGCFNAVIAPDAPFILTLASYPSLAASKPLAKNSPRQGVPGGGDEYNSMTELSYIRMESSLLWAFPSMPAVAVPPTGENRPARIFELRTYEAPNDKAWPAKSRCLAMAKSTSSAVPAC